MTEATGFDFTRAYRASGYGSIAWRATGYAQERTPDEWTFVGGPDDDPDDETNYVYDEPMLVDDHSRVVAVMIGDDRPETFGVDDLEPIAREDYCGECGAIGCAHDGYPRDDDE